MQLMIKNVMKTMGTKTKNTVKVGRWTSWAPNFVQTILPPSGKPEPVLAFALPLAGISVSNRNSYVTCISAVFILNEKNARHCMSEFGFK